MSRDDWLARVSAGLPGSDRRPGRTRRPITAIVLGWLVLMTVWGFGRAWHGGWAPVEGVVGLVGGVVATIVTWPRAPR